ncbi:hypothetical protein FA743_19500 [Paracoccus gahaiensis]|uniref:Phage gp6-like head-tail connector protein n=1 Tax=Paracoccus gahaiensis TaxID=1706839 RepID=A0A4U0R2T6_9RHOB|nr:hypothetical protein [Paracoccus gahaiensis]TJZ89007.1 hypothetical protein FA743_19500 [Paracoccus gahaiensis]
MRARVDGDFEDMDIQRLADTAAAEIEAHCGLALLGQVVTVTLQAWCKRIPLAIGPFWPEGLADHPVTVELLDEAGNITPHPAGWWITPGRYPVLNLTASVHGAALRIRYPAGYGTRTDSIPPDLQLAIADHAAMLYDARGFDDEMPQGLSMAAARIAARHRRVAI